MTIVWDRISLKIAKRLLIRTCTFLRGEHALQSIPKEKSRRRYHRLPFLDASLPATHKTSAPTNTFHSLKVRRNTYLSRS